MELEAFAIFAVCLAGGIWTSYKQGLINGSEATLAILEEQKLIRVRDDGDIEPYK